ncbi:hypothetical protein JNUCC0626_42345 [Lentzea sp. JNUCC 0626]|uniref:hypothetical protein n=1 Tax=Lentzea sp. JNUCC 0626 TaxID=3367513 RepID=UPI00374A3E4B
MWSCPKADRCECCGSSADLVLEVRPFYPEETAPFTRVRYACATFCQRCFQQGRTFLAMLGEDVIHDRMADHERGHRPKAS